MSEAERQLRRGEVLGLLEQMRDVVVEDAEMRDRVPASPIASAVVEILSRALGLYKAAVLLLHADLTDEALLLGRILFEKSLWLMELADTQGKRRASLVLWWLNESYTRARELIESGVTAGLAPMTSRQGEMLTDVDERIRGVRQFQREYDVGGITQFLGVEEAARLFHRLGGWWMYELANHVAHGHDTPHPLHGTDTAPEVYFTPTAEPEVIATCGVFCAESVIASHIAAAQLLEREPLGVEQLRELLGALRALADQ